MDDALAGLEQALHECGQAHVWSWPDHILIDHLDRMQALASKVAAWQLELVREVDARGIPAAQGATGTAAWLRDRHGLSPAVAARQVKLATALHTDVPDTAAALAAGTLNVEQAQLIAAAVTTLPTEFRTTGEQYLIGQAASFGPRELGRLSERLLEVVAPEVAEQREADRLARAEQRAHLDRSLQLTDLPGEPRVRLTGWLDREGASVVSAALDPLCAPRPSNKGPDPRTPGQRRADALVDVCRLALATEQLPDNGGDRPQVVVTVDFDTLRARIGTATLDDGGILSAAAARRLACDAAIIPAVLGGKGQVLDLGRGRRLITGPLRRALIVRDKGCAFPGCDRPPRWCDGHHITHWANGGPTTLNNTVLLCRRHHHTVHQGHWHIRINPTDGHPDFIPPRYADPTHQPRRNTHHQRTDVRSTGRRHGNLHPLRRPAGSRVRRSEPAWRPVRQR